MFTLPAALHKRSQNRRFIFGVTSKPTTHTQVAHRSITPIQAEPNKTSSENLLDVWFWILTLFHCLSVWEMCHCQTSQMFHSGAYPCYLKMVDGKYQENMKILRKRVVWWLTSAQWKQGISKNFMVRVQKHGISVIYIENYSKCSPLSYLSWSITHSWESRECSCQSDPPIECLGRREETFLLSHSSWYLSPTCYRNNHWLATVVPQLRITLNIYKNTTKMNVKKSMGSRKQLCHFHCISL